MDLLIDYQKLKKNFLKYCKFNFKNINKIKNNF